IGCALAVAAVLSACGSSPRPAPATLKDRYEIDTTDVSADAVRAFVSHAREIAATGTGNFTIDELAAVIPMAEDQRQLLRDACSAPLSASCSGGRCTGYGDGQPVEAIAHASAGIIRDPYIGLNSHVEIQFVQRGAAAIEFCNASGIYLRKSFIRKDLQGM